MMDSSSIFTVTPMSQSITLSAGDVYEGDVTVVNPADAVGDFHYKVEVAPYAVLGEEYNADFLTESDRSQITNWIKVDNPKGVLKPNESTKVHFRIKVPETAPAGGQYAALLISSDDDVSASDGAIVNNVFEMASILYAKIDGEILRKGEIISNEIPGFVTTPSVRVSATLRNDGNIHEAAHISVEVKNCFSTAMIYPEAGESGTIDEIVMPGTTRYVTRDIEGLPAIGIYDVSQTVNYMGQTEALRQIVVACPAWFMALLLVIAVAAITSIVYSIKKRRLKKQIL